MNCASEGTTGKGNVLGTSLVIGTVFPKLVSDIWLEVIFLEVKFQS